MDIMKKTIYLLFAISFFIFENGHAQTLAGAGTEASPYLIGNETDLVQVGQYPNSYLATDIFLQLTDNINLTQNWNPIGNSTI